MCEVIGCYEGKGRGGITRTSEWLFGEMSDGGRRRRRSVVRRRGNLVLDCSKPHEFHALYWNVGEGRRRGPLFRSGHETGVVERESRVGPWEDNDQLVYTEIFL